MLTLNLVLDINNVNSWLLKRNIFYRRYETKIAYVYSRRLYKQREEEGGREMREKRERGGGILRL